MRLLALGGATGPAVFGTLVVVCGALRPGYRHLTQFVSELGADGTSHAVLMNLAGFLPSGLLIALFAVSLAAVLPRRPLAVVAAGMVGLFGVGIAVAGVYSCDPGCPRQAASLEGMVHNRVAEVAFLAGIGGVGLSALQFRAVALLRPLWLYSAGSSAVSLTFLAAVAASMDSRTLTGLWQRLLLATLFGWCAVVGLRVYRFAAGGRTVG